jgi:hypothetical protein
MNKQEITHAPVSNTTSSTQVPDGSVLHKSARVQFILGGKTLFCAYLQYECVNMKQTKHGRHCGARRRSYLLSVSACEILPAQRGVQYHAMVSFEGHLPPGTTRLLLCIASSLLQIVEYVCPRFRGHLDESIVVQKRPAYSAVDVGQLVCHRMLPCHQGKGLAVGPF